MPDPSPEVIAIQKAILGINETIEDLKKKQADTRSDSLISELKTKIEELTVSREEMRAELKKLKPTEPPTPEPIPTPQEDKNYELGHFDLK